MSARGFLVGHAQLVALFLLTAFAFLQAEQRLAQQLTGEMQHARMCIDGQRFRADARAAAERLQARGIVWPTGQAPALRARERSGR